MAAGWERLFDPKPEEGSAARLDRYARDTMHCLLMMIDPDTGLPANRVTLSNSNVMTPSTDTTPTDMGFGIGVLVAGKDMGVIPPAVAREKVGHILSTLQVMKRVNGLFYNWYDIESAEITTTHHSGGKVEPFISSVDNAWLALMLMLAREAFPELEGHAGNLLSMMDFPQLYDPDENLYWGGYYPNRNTHAGHYPLYGSETRINAIVGIAEFGISPNAYTELYKRKEKSRNVILSGGGSMFEDLLPSLFVPETEWSREWEANIDSYIQRQVSYGKKEAFGFWGWSPCDDPDGNYTEYGLH